MSSFYGNDGGGASANQINNIIKQAIVVSQDEPVGQQTGNLWIKITEQWDWNKGFKIFGKNYTAPFNEGDSIATAVILKDGQQLLPSQFSQYILTDKQIFYQIIPDNEILIKTEGVASIELGDDSLNKTGTYTINYNNQLETCSINVIQKEKCVIDSYDGSDGFFIDITDYDNQSISPRQWAGDNHNRYFPNSLLHVDEVRTILLDAHTSKYDETTYEQHAYDLNNYIKNIDFVSCKFSSQLINFYNNQGMNLKQGEIAVEFDKDNRKFYIRGIKEGICGFAVLITFNFDNSNEINWPNQNILLVKNITVQAKND